jgi:multiple sugar transport system substrate-binding protein
MFIDYITNDVEANKVLLGERGVPINPKVADAITPLLTPAQVEVQNYLAIVSKEAAPLPPPDPAVQTNLSNNIYLPQLVDPVLLKQVSPESAMEQYRKDATNLLATSS